MTRARQEQRRRRGRGWGAAAALTALVGGIVGIGAGVAHASGFGTVQVIADSAHGAPENGVCLNIVVPGPKNSADVVVASNVSSGEGVAGLISVGNVPVGTYIARFDDCGAPSPFASFYYGGTFNKANARTFGVTDGGLTNLGTQLMSNSGTTGSIDGTLLDASNPGDGVPSISVVAYTASGKNLLAEGCTNQDGHYVLFEMPHTGGGVKLYFGKGASCSNDDNFVPQWYGGTAYANATPITIVPTGNVTANATTLSLVTKPNVSVTAVSFAGNSANPIITVDGSGFGKKPKPNPSGRPCGEPDVAGNGFDYANNVVFWDLNDSALWQAGFPGDCIGINFVSYTSTQIVFTLGDWYRDPTNGARPLTVGDQFTLRIKGAPITGILTSFS